MDASLIPVVKKWFWAFYHPTAAQSCICIQHALKPHICVSPLLVFEKCRASITTIMTCLQRRPFERQVRVCVCVYSACCYLQYLRLNNIAKTNLHETHFVNNYITVFFAFLLQPGQMFDKITDHFAHYNNFSWGCVLVEKKYYFCL